MSKKVKSYCQCSLRKDNRHTVGYIDSDKATLDNLVTIEWEDGRIEGGWMVMTVGLPQDAKYVEANARNYLKQRKASDVIFNDIKKANNQACSGF